VDDPATRICFWHQRLGHPFFLLLQHIFFLYFCIIMFSKFQFETCELAKNHHVSFSPSINKSVEPFVLVDTDV
jgi:hypothetical protein